MRLLLGFVHELHVSLYVSQWQDNRLHVWRQLRSQLFWNLKSFTTFYTLHFTLNNVESTLPISTFIYHTQYIQQKSQHKWHHYKALYENKYFSCFLTLYSFQGNSGVNNTDDQALVENSSLCCCCHLWQFSKMAVHLLHLGPPWSRGFVFYRSKCWGRLDQQGKMPTKVFKATSQEERDSLDRRSSGSWRRSSQCTWFPHISISTHWLSHISIKTHWWEKKGWTPVAIWTREPLPTSAVVVASTSANMSRTLDNTFVTTSAPVTYSL